MILFQFQDLTQQHITLLLGTGFGVGGSRQSLNRTWSSSSKSISSSSGSRSVKKERTVRVSGLDVRVVDMSTRPIGVLEWFGVVYDLESLLSGESV